MISVISIISSLMAFLFYFSGLSKIFSFQEFLNSITNLLNKELLPRKAIAILVISTELILALLFSLNLFLFFSYIIAILTFLVFTFFLIRAFVKHQDIVCNCFGIQKGLTNKKLSITRNTILIFLCIIGLVLSPLELELGLEEYNRLFSPFFMMITSITIISIQHIKRFY
ncbi:MauE/DoxX family redox-associated membrane protein [Rossellomorea arthrocnemi]|uniref:MauE/DoxX family redox-associated membrane protein n=1 Tax=Rossellomorea arthrocnemi TaxID=2769542 RepID=UPI00191B6030